MRAIEVAKPHGFLIWKGRQEALLLTETLEEDSTVAIISDGEYFGDAVIGVSLVVNSKGIESTVEKHKVKNYEAEDEMIYHQIKAFMPLDDPVLAKIENGELIIEELPEETEEMKEFLDTAEEELPNIIPLGDDLLINREGIVMGDFPDEVLQTISKGLGIEVKKGDLQDNEMLKLYSLVLQRNPVMKFKYVEPPNLRMSTMEDVSCKYCEFWKQGICSAYGIATANNQLCNSFSPKYKGTVVMLPLPVEIGSKFALTSQEVPDGSEIIMPDDMHVTLYYEEANSDTLLKFPQLIKTLTDTYYELYGEINGVGKFENVDDGTKDAIILHIDSQQIKTLHRDLYESLGINPDEVRFTPHITLAYVPAGTAIPNINVNRMEVFFNKLVLKSRGEKIFESQFNSYEEDEFFDDIFEDKQMNKKGLVLQLDKIRGEFNSKFETDNDWYYLLDVLEDNSIIVENDGDRYKVNFTFINDEYVFDNKNLWVKVNTVYEDKAWSGSASNYESTEAYCSACLIDVNPSGEKKIQSMCMLPVKKPGSSSIDPEGLQAAAGGHGVTQVKKPKGVDQSTFDAAKKRAANTIISNYPKLLDKNAPDSVYQVAGKTPPKSKSLLSWFFKKKEEKEDSILIELMNPAAETGFAIKEDKNGQPIFFTWSSNAFKDREGEIISTKALENYVDENQINEVKGYFNFWHIPGTDFAVKTFQAVIGRFLLEAGPFMNNEAGKAAYKFFKEYPTRHDKFAPEGWGASVEFKYLPDQGIDGIYEWLWITRTSVLPRAKAANIYTFGGLNMKSLEKLTPQQRELGIQLFGSEEELEKMVEAGMTKTAMLEKEEEFKEVEDEVTEESEETVEETVAEEPTEEEVTEETTEEVTEEEKEVTEEKPVEETTEEVAAEAEAEEEATDETPNVDLVKQVAQTVVEVLNESLKEKFNVLDTIPEAFNQINERLEKVETANEVKKAATETRNGWFSSLKAASVTEQEGNMELDEAKEKGPKQTKANDNTYGAPFFSK